MELKGKKVTCGSYRWNFPENNSYSFMQTVGKNPRVVYDLLHPAHDKVVEDEVVMLFDNHGDYQITVISDALKKVSKVLGEEVVLLL